MLLQVLHTTQCPCPCEAQHMGAFYVKYIAIWDGLCTMYHILADITDLGTSFCCIRSGDCVAFSWVCCSYT